jgi:hypothetical protein
MLTAGCGMLPLPGRPAPTPTPNVGITVEPAGPGATPGVQPTRAPGLEEAPSPAPPSEEQAIPPVALQTRTLQKKSDVPDYTIDARWPALDWGDDPRAAAFNQAAEAYADSSIRTFERNAAELPPPPEGIELYQSSLQIHYAPTITTGGLLSVLFQNGFYMAGAAHPGSYSYAINYDLRAGRELALENLFQPGSAYLEEIARYCREYLAARDVLEWEEGVQPIAENYRVWNITPDGLLITFDAYQVASYAAGPQSVIVPYETLRPLLLPGGPLEEIIP